MQDSALDAELVALVVESVTMLAPNAQQMCEMQHICAGLQSLGCFRVSDLLLLLGGDLLILQAALAPTPIMFLMKLKHLALASAPSVAASASPAPGAPGAGPTFQTPTGTAGELTPHPQR
jgi:hypothetical protein